MDKQGYVHRRKKRYMAQLLEYFEEHVESHLPDEVAQDFKRMVRRKMNAVAVDACEIMSLKPGEEINGVMTELRDKLHPEGQPIRQRSNQA